MPDLEFKNAVAPILLFATASINRLIVLEKLKMSETSYGHWKSLMAVVNLL